MAEPADATDLKSVSERSGGSNPPRATNYISIYIHIIVAYTEKQLVALEALRKNAIAYAKQVAKPRSLIEKEKLKRKVTDYIRDNQIIPSPFKMLYQRKACSYGVEPLVNAVEQFVDGLLDAIFIEIYGELWNSDLYNSTNKNGLVWIKKTELPYVDYTYIVCIKYPNGNILDLRLSENFELLKYDYIKGGAYAERKLYPASPEIVNKVYSILINEDIGTRFVDAFINSAEEVENES